MSNLKTYSAILADPPWSYNDKNPRGGAENHYRTMSFDELVAFQVGGHSVATLGGPDSALFMWATWPLLGQAIALIRAWGYQYKTCAFDWVKVTKGGDPAFGLGHYTRGNTEPCLLGVRGRVKRVDAGVSQVVLDESFAQEALFAPRGPHSAKPPEVRDRIVRLLGDVPRVELFARARADGWDAHGDELPPTGAPQ